MKYIKNLTIITFYVFITITFYDIYINFSKIEFNYDKQMFIYLIGFAIVIVLINILSDYIKRKREEILDNISNNKKENEIIVENSYIREIYLFLAFIFLLIIGYKTFLNEGLTYYFSIFVLMSILAILSILLLFSRRPKNISIDYKKYIDSLKNIKIYKSKFNLLLIYIAILFLFIVVEFLLLK